MDEKVILSLVSVFIGWFLAQGTAFVKDAYLGWKLKKALLLELSDIFDQLHRSEMVYHRQLQISALRGIDPSVPLPVPNLFFRQYYKDVFYRLNRSQRLSYQLIHGTIDTLNSENDDFLKFTKETVEALNQSKDEAAFSRSLSLWSERVSALYRLVQGAKWYIQFHLKKSKNPAFDIRGAMHESYLKYVANVDEEIKKIMEGAKSLKREDFEKIYDEKLFRQTAG